MLFAEVERRRIDVIDREREAGEMLGDEDTATHARWIADAARVLLDAAKDRYIAESEAVRRQAGCVVHGDALFVACPDRFAQLHPKRAA